MKTSRCILMILLLMTFFNVIDSQACGGIVIAISTNYYAGSLGTKRSELSSNSSDVDDDSDDIPCDDWFDCLDFPPLTTSPFGKRQGVPSINGVLGLSVTYQVAAGNALCLSIQDPILIPGKGYVIPEVPIKLKQYLVQDRVTIGLTVQDRIATNLEFAAKSLGDCPLGEDVVSSSTNLCADNYLPNCRNQLLTDQVSTGCFIDDNTADVMTATYIKSYGQSFVKQLGPVVDRLMDIETSLFSSQGSYVDEKSTFSLLSQQYQNLNFYPGKIAFVDVRDQNPYTPGVKFLYNVTGFPVYEGNNAQEYDYSRNGAVKINPDKSLRFNTVGLPLITQTTVNNLRNDDYSHTFGASRTDTSKMTKLETVLRPYASINYVAENFISISPVGLTRYTWNFVINATNIRVNYKVVGVTSFNCSGQVNSAYGGILQCYVTKAEDTGVTRFSLLFPNGTSILTQDVSVTKNNVTKFNVVMGSMGPDVKLMGCMPNSNMTANNSRICYNIFYQEEQPAIVEPNWVTRQNGSVSGGGSGIGINVPSDFNLFDFGLDNLSWIIPVVVIIIIIVIIFIVVLIVKKKTNLPFSNVIMMPMNSFKRRYSKVDDESEEMIEKSPPQSPDVKRAISPPNFRNLIAMTRSQAPQSAVKDYDRIISSYDSLYPNSSFDAIRDYYNVKSVLRSDVQGIRLLPEFESAPPMRYPGSITSPFGLAQFFKANNKDWILVPDNEVA